MRFVFGIVLIFGLLWPAAWCGDVEALNKTKEYDAFEVVDKSPAELIEIRGFKSEVHYAVTRDGYHIQVVRVINPLNTEESGVFKRPVIFNHGLLESATIWLINSRNVRPIAPPTECGMINLTSSTGDDWLHMNAPLMLSNYGYDVWLMSMRGTDWSTTHDTLTTSNPKFWDYSLDDFALTDIPTVVDYVRRATGAPKVGYVGHSQATFSILGLLSVRTLYSKVIEPVVAVAPVSYMDNLSSIARILFVGADRLSSQHGPFPRNARDIRLKLSSFCKLKTTDLSCQLLETFVAGPGKKMHKGFFGHLPFFTSVKVLRHFGQLVKAKRNLMYDYGREENLRLYGQPSSPSYPLERINSNSLCFFSAETDALSVKRDVDKLRNRLKVKLYKDINIKGEFNHFDLVIDNEATYLVNQPMLEVFESFELKAGGCSTRRKHKHSIKKKPIELPLEELERKIVDSEQLKELYENNNQKGEIEPVDQEEERESSVEQGGKFQENDDEQTLSRRKRINED